MGTVTDAWADIERWLARHAPRSAALLAGPADAAAIAAAEARLGLAFPPELVESLSRHNGLTQWDNLFPGHPPLSVDGIVEHYEMCLEIDEDEGDYHDTLDEGEEPWWHELWLPFSQIDGDSQIFDLRPGPGHGRLGTAVHDNSGDFTHAWPSLGAYLADTAGALLRGGGADGNSNDGRRYWVPYLTPESTLWWSSAGETHLNGKPLRPAPVEVSTCCFRSV
ncbi:SMI1/KNR4 family protein [Virgisporangium ochraceum]|nr:SMI1/KNR4 family protein [Virgisporangium ochraceum]